MRIILHYHQIQIHMRDGSMERLSLPKMQKLQNEYLKHTYTCKCGHRVFILAKKDKVICNWCKNYVFKNKQDEFKYRVNEKMRRVENDR